MLSSVYYDAPMQAPVVSCAITTVACRQGEVPALADIPQIRMDAAGRVTDMLIGRVGDGAATYGIGVYVMRKDWLMDMINEAVARNLQHFERDILQRRLHEIKIYGYEVPSLVMPIYSLSSYYNANLALLDGTVRAQLFPNTRPVYTKVRDCAPVCYGLHAQVTNSLVADGAHIDGTVKNSVIFRGVNIGRDTVVEDCVVMQDVTITDRCSLTCVIADKNAVFREGRTLQGFESYPVYIAKNAIV